MVARTPRTLLAVACTAVCAFAAPAAHAAVAPPAINDLVPDLTFGSDHIAEAIAVHVAPSGDILVADPGNNDIARFTPDGTFIDSFDGSDSGTPLNLPSGVATDADGNIYIDDYANARIAKFDAEGNFLTSFNGSDSPGHHLVAPGGVTVSGSTVYVTDSSADVVETFTTDGTFQSAFGSAGAGDGQLDEPFGLGVDSAGDVYVADWGNDRIEVFNPDGSYKSQFGSSGSGPGQFDGPSAVSLDGDGNVFVADRQNSRGQKFTAGGTHLATFGPQDGTTWVFGVASDGAMSVYLTMDATPGDLDTGSQITRYSPRAEATSVDGVGSDTATAHGIVRPNGADTLYEFRWKRVGTTRWHHTALADAGNGTDRVPVSATLPHLRADTDYIVRVRVHIGTDLEKSNDVDFTTSPAPAPVLADITLGPVTDLTATTATINADVAGHGGDDTVSVLYQLEGSSYVHVRRLHTTDDLVVARRHYHRTLDVRPGTHYTYHVEVTNSAGGPVSSASGAFTTTGGP